MRSPTATSMSPSSSFSSLSSIVASPLPPTLTNATSAPMATMVPSMVWPFLKRFDLVDASNNAAKSSSISLTTRSSSMLSAMSMMFSCEREEGVAVLRLEHGKVNAMDLPLCEALTKQLGVLAADSCEAVVLTGAGNSFCAGVDLVRLAKGGPEYVKHFLLAMDTLFHTLLTFPKPMVAALNGHALAGGCIIAACCDHVVMADGQRRVGVTELAVGVPFPMLPLEIVRARVTERDGRDLAYSARTLLPAEAMVMGLVDQVVP
ncbi:MAG: enoyl-CoA hydratase/isomerase family protein, partial [Acidobacteria bacterium]|nr:enoyl-CoA hydratase/isomerase family protein [Acidobacteriota bacterium]